MTSPQFDASLGNIALMAITQTPNPTDDNSTLFETHTEAMKAHSKKYIAPYIVPHPTPKLPKNLPGPIIELNNRRQSTGLKEFEEYKAKNALPKQLPRPSFLTLEVPALPQLHDGLTYIFRSFISRTGSQARLALDERKSEIVRWTHGLDHSLNSWTSLPSSSDSKEGFQPKLNDAVELLVHLNGLIGKSDVKMKKLFYEASTLGQIDNVLDKLQTVSKSVRVQKEVEEFEDERKEWLGECEGG